MFRLMREAEKEGINFTILPLGGYLGGFCYKSLKGNYHIIINEILSQEEREKIARHELYHIKNHFPQHPYIITLDLHHSAIENEADYFLTVKKK